MSLQVLTGCCGVPALPDALHGLKASGAPGGLEACDPPAPGAPAPTQHLTGHGGSRSCGAGVDSFEWPAGEPFLGPLGERLPRVVVQALVDLWLQGRCA